MVHKVDQFFGRTSEIAVKDVDTDGQGLLFSFALVVSLGMEELQMAHVWTLLGSTSYLHVIRVASPSSLMFLQPHETRAHVCVRCASYGPSTAGFKVTAC